MTFPLWPFPAALFVGRTDLGLYAVIFAWRWSGVWRHRKLRLA